MTLEVQLNDRFVDFVAERIDIALRAGRLRDWGFVQGNSRLHYRPNCPFSLPET